MSNIDITQFYLTNIIDPDFDDVFYIKQYPETQDFYQPFCQNNNINNKYRLYYHYKIYGEKNHAYKNLKEMENDLLGVNFIVPKYFNAEEYENIYPESNQHLFKTGSLIAKEKKIYHHFLSSQKKNITTKNIYIKVVNGLANRIRTLNSFFSYATKHNRKLYVCWENGPGWSNEKFHDLFEDIDCITFISNEEYNNKTKNIFNLDKHIYKTDDNPDYYIINIPSQDILNKIENEEFSYFGDSCLEYMFTYSFREESTIYKLLKPKASISETIENTTSQFNEKTIGIHIRRGDAMNSPWDKNFKVSDDNTFIEAINNEIRLNPDVKFFLATDCIKTQEKFCSLFPQIIVNNTKIFFDSVDHTKPKDNQKDAVIDMMALSETKYIIGSNWSSFSYISSKFRHIPLKIALNHRQDHEKQISDNIKVSLICAVKNRKEQLLFAIRSWILFKEIEEIIIVDWSSDESIDDIANIDPRIKIIKVPGEKYFHLSKAYNIAIRSCKNRIILKMDTDYILNPYYNFFNIYRINRGEFLTGSWSDKYLDHNIGFFEYLNGFIYAYKSDLLDIEGYNENFEGYGYDDSDLYSRLEESGCRRLYLNHNCAAIFHTPHANSKRFENYKCSDINISHDNNVIISQNRHINKSKNRNSKIIGITSQNGTLDNAYLLDSKTFLNKIGNNSGNLVFQYAIWNFINEEKIYINNMTPTEINSRCKYVVVPSSSFISENVDYTNWANFLKNIKVPLIFLGVGVQAKNYEINKLNLHQSVLDIIELFKNPDNIVGVRGEYTKEFLKLYGVENTVVIGCPSNFINPNNPIETIEKKWNNNIDSIMCNSGVIWSGDNTKSIAEKKIVSLIIDKNGPYIIQSIDPLIDLVRYNNTYHQKSELKTSNIMKSLLPQKYLNDEIWINNFIHSRFKTYINITQWLEDAARCDFSFGLRLHGNMVSFQSGCPTVWIYHDSRTQELCETMQLPRISIEEFITNKIITLEDVKKYATYNPNLYSETREILRKSTKEILSNYKIKNLL
jgi:hypothetical protein